MSQSLDLTNFAVSHPALEHPDALLQAIINSGTCVLYQTPDLIYQWAENLPPFLKNKWCQNYRDTDIFPRSFSERLETLKLDVLSSGANQSIEVNFKDINDSSAESSSAEGDDAMWYKLCISCHKDSSNRTIGVITTAIDVSHLKHREKILRILLREVSHRSKNLLAIVDSLARQTARYTSSTSKFMQEFEGRIQSLSQTQDLVTDANWLGVRFKSLANIQLQDKLCNKADYIDITGDNPYLFPNSTLYLGLALHELASNSRKNGVLKNGQGKLTINCHRDKNEKDNPMIRITWQECYTDITQGEEQEKSFANIILTKIVPTAVNGYVCYNFSKNSLTYELSMPYTQFD